jgi:hypothetical protein
VISLILALVAPAPDAAWAEFSRDGTVIQVDERIEIRLATTDTPTRTEYELVYTLEEPRRQAKFITTSVNCPAVRPVIASMRELKMPRLAPYGIQGENRGSMQDGTYYKLSAPTEDSEGRITLTATEGSPLAAWIDQAFSALQSCWPTAG